MLRMLRSTQIAFGEWIGSLETLETLAMPLEACSKEGPPKEAPPCLVYSPEPAWPFFYHSFHNMRAAGGATFLLFILVLAKPTPNASAPERFVTVSPEGDFMLGCQKFLVAGWNQLRAGAQRLRPALFPACLVRAVACLLGALRRAQPHVWRPGSVLHLLFGTPASPA